MLEGLLVPSHLIIILAIVLLLFGAKRIPELARGLGSGVREFKKGAEGGDKADEVRGSGGKPGLGGRSENGANARDRDGTA